MPTAGVPDEAQTAPVSAEPGSEKYPVLQAASETIAAMRVNLAAYLVSVVLAFAASIVGIGLLIVPVISVYVAIAHKGGISTGSTVGLIIGAVVFAIIWFLATGAFVLTYTALALDAGANGRRSGVGETLRASFGHFRRVIIADLFIVVAAMGPLLAVILISVPIVSFAKPLAVLTIVGGVAGTIWVYVALLRYMMAPYVAIFEPELPASRLLSRSRQLMKKGGQWFIIKEFVVVFLGLALLSYIAGTASHGSSGPLSLVVNLVSFAATLVASGMIVMLYRNRKLVRS